MSDYKEQLSDTELQRLLRLSILEDEEDSVFTQKMMEMEATVLFSSEPLAVPGIQAEKELLTKLNTPVSPAGSLKWLLPVAIGTLLFIAAFYLMMNQTGTNTALPVRNSDLQNAPGKTIPPALVTPDDTTKKRGNEPDILSTAPKSSLINALVSSEALQVLAPNVTVVDSPVTPIAPMPLTNYPGELNSLLPVGMPAPISPLLPIVPLDTHFEPVPYEEGNGQKDLDTLFEGVKRLEVNGTFCEIEVKTTDKSSVRANGKIDLRSKKPSNVPDYAIHYEKTGDVLKVWIQKEKTTKRRIVSHSMEVHSFLHFEVPASTEVVLKNNSGDINLDGLNGTSCSALTVYGDIKASNIGTNILLSSQSGDISLVNLLGDATVQSNYGDQVFENVTGNISSKHVSGDVKIDQVKGNIDLKATYGDASIQHQSGEFITIYASSGDIKLGDIKGNKCTITTNYGNISGQNISAELELTSVSGDIRVNAVTGNISSKSTYGDTDLLDVSGNVTTTSTSGNTKLSNITGDVTTRATNGDFTADKLDGSMLINVVSGNIKGTNITAKEKVDVTTNRGDIRLQLLNPEEELSYDLQSDSGDVEVGSVRKSAESSNKLLITKGKILIKGRTQSGDQEFR